MQHREKNSLGAVCSILVGILTATGAITYLLLPAEQRVLVRGAELLPSAAQDMTLLQVEFFQLAMVGVLGLAVVPAVAALVPRPSGGWLQWASNLAYTGFAVMAVTYFFTMGRLPGLAAAFAAGEPATKAALIPIWRSSLDLFGLWQFGAVGFWVLVVTWLARRDATLPLIPILVGLALSLLHFLVAAAIILKVPTLLLLAVGAATLAAPVWYVWVGLRLLRVELKPG